MPEKLLINKIWLNSGCGDSGIYREWENRRRIVKNIREIFQKLKNIHWRAYAILIHILYLDKVSFALRAFLQQFYYFYSTAW